MAQQRMIFTGAPGTGKTFVAKYCADIFGRNGKKVALIDATKERGLYFSLALDEVKIYKDAVSCGLAALVDQQKNFAVNLGNIDLFTDAPQKQVDMKKFFESFQNIQSTYDLVIVDAEIPWALELMDQKDRMLLIQDCHRRSLYSNQQDLLVNLVKQLGNEKLPETIIVYNKFMECKMKLNSIEDTLLYISEGGVTKDLLASVKPKDIVIEFSIDAYYSDLNNIADGHLEVGRLDSVTKSALLKLCTLIEPMKFKKI